MLTNEYSPAKTIMLELLMMPQMLGTRRIPRRHTENISSRRSRPAWLDDTEQDIAMTDWDGTEYRQVSDLQQWLARLALEGLKLDGVGSVLDVGCGDSALSSGTSAQ